MRAGNRARKVMLDQAARLLLILGGVTMCIPFAWMVTTSLKDDRDLIQNMSRWMVTLPQRTAESTVGLDYIFFTTDAFSEVVAEDFESEDPGWRAEGAGAARSTLAEGLSAGRREAAQARANRGALAFTLRSSEGDTVTAGRIFEPPLAVPEWNGIHFWLDGDSSGSKLTLTVETDRGTFTTGRPWTVNFGDWRELSTTVREEDRLGGMPVLYGAGALGAPVDVPLSQPFGVEVRSIAFTLHRVPYPVALWERLTDNYRQVWESIPLGLYYWNTLLVASVVAVGQVATSSLAGYAFARLRFPGRDVIFYCYLATMMIPGHVTMIPRFIIINKAHLYDTFAALVIPGLSSTFGTFLMRQFFMTLPRELEDAAIIDGCNRLGVYARIMLPLSKPALATLGVMSFIGAWQMFLWALISTNSVSLRVLQVGLASMRGDLSGKYNLVMAGSIIALLPAVIIFASAQKAFKEGIVLTGLKG